METAPLHEPAERRDETSAPAEAPSTSPLPAAAAASDLPPAVASGSSPFATRSPLDDQPLSLVEATDPASIQGLVDRARAAQRAWAEVSIRDRALAIGQVKQRLLARAAE